MIKNLFALPVYIGRDDQFLPITRQWFKDPTLFPQREEFPFTFDTTLRQYNPSKSKIASDLLSRDDSKDFQSFIINSVKEYLEQSDYITNCEIAIPNMWMNAMTSNAVHRTHKHFGYTFSGTYYVEVPKGSGILNLVNPIQDNINQAIVLNERANANNVYEFQIPVDDGTLVLFPSFVKHHVPSLKFQGTRKSIAFDVIISYK